MPPRLKTRLLFGLLLRGLKPDLVCDVGSLDGGDSLRFRSSLPGARIVAFEAHPGNLESMRDNKALRQAGIEIQGRAVHDHDGSVRFHVQDLPGGMAGRDARRGISSTRQRMAGEAGTQGESVAGATDAEPEGRPVDVECVRLDTFVAGLTSPAPSRVALWIDVEGAAHEVLLGVEGIREKVKVIHVEVESRAFWKGQKVESDVVALLDRLGFRVLARGRNDDQHDLVAVRRQEASRLMVQARLGLAWFLSLRPWRRR